jgi:hypothetical protein
MTFVHPALLWILPLAAIPLLLHLLTLHRLKTVELSTFRFLFDSYVQQRRRMQFLEALLAVLRTLFLLFLIFLFTRPVVRHWDALFRAGGGTGGREVVLLMDCSASMAARSGGTSAFDRAKAAALSVIDRLGPDDRLTLVRVGNQPEELLSRFNTDTKGIHDAVENLKTTSSRGNVFAALLKLFGPEATARSNPLVYLFTDCQASGWREVRNQGLDRLVPAGTPFVVVDVGSKEPMPNQAVVGDAPRRNRAIAGLPFTLQPRVVNYSKTDRAELTLSVFLNEKEIARAPLTLKPGEAAVRKVTYAPREPGLLRGRFEITGKTPDRFPDDDRFLFTLAVEPRVRVLLVNGNPVADPVENDARYLFTALTTAPEAEKKPEADKKPGTPEALKEFQRSLDVREVPEAGVTPEALKDASLVVLANCGALSAAQFEMLRNYVLGGGGLLIFPGDKVNPQTYDTQFFPVPGPQGERLTAASMGPAEGDPEKAETFEQLATFDFAHPALAAFDSPDPDVRHFKTVRIYKRYKLTLPPKKGNAWPLARFGSGAPALVESRLGEGTVVLAAFPAHTRWTNLPTRPDFVPLVLRLAAHVERRPEADVAPVVLADGTAEVSVNASWAPAEATVRDPAGRTVPLTLERSGPRLLGAFEQTRERGYYTVDVRSGRSDQTKAAALAFAVNLSPEESDLTKLGEKDVRELLPNTDLTFVDASAEAQARGPVGKEQEIWPLLIWVVFGVIGVEFLLATLGGRPRHGEEEVSVCERVRRLSPGSWVGRMTGAGRKSDG